MSDSSKARSRVRRTVVAGALLGVGWLVTQSLANRAEPRPEHRQSPSSPTPTIAAVPAPAPDRDRQWSAEPPLDDPAATTHRGAGHAPEAVVLDLAPEELDILERYSADGLAEAIKDAATEYLRATDSNREALERRYDLVQNLAAKLSPPWPEPEMPPDMAAAYDEYLHTLALRAEELSQLGPAERFRQLDEIKEAIVGRFDRRQ
jgi:hypothetical protein